MKCEYCGSPAWYRCARTGVLLCPRHARLEVVAPRPQARSTDIDVRPAGAENYRRLKELALHFWGETEVKCFERTYEVTELAAFVRDELVGFLSYVVEEQTLNVVMLSVGLGLVAK